MVLLLAAPQPVAAEPPADAQRLFQQGEALFQRGLYIEAARKFEQWFAAHPERAALWSAAVAYDKGHDRVNAFRLYERFLTFIEGSTDDIAGQIAEARRALRRLERWLRQTHARVLIRTQPPGAGVEVDGSDVGWTTPDQRWLTEGRHPIRVHLEGYRDHRVELVLGAAGDQTLEVTLQPLPRVGQIEVRSTPPGVAVRIDGEPAGQTPLSRELPAGEHTIELAAPGRETVRQTVTLVAGKHSVVEITLAATSTTPDPDTVTPPDDDSIWTSWWLWTVVGAVVVGGVVTGVVLGLQGDETTAPAPADWGTYAPAGSGP